MKIHQLRIDFNVTEQIKRFVYVYIVEAENCYLIDSGVYGCEKQIIAYLEFIGRGVEDVKAVFITHAHPDHVGSAAFWQSDAESKIYASQGEKAWIEDVDLHFKERPIPNFYKLAGKSAKVDVVVQDGDRIILEPGLEVKVLRTAGHSGDEVSYQLGDALFIGDTVPVKGDIPIMVNIPATKASLELLGSLEDVKTFYPAWDKTYDKEAMLSKLQEAKQLIDVLEGIITKADKEMPLQELVEVVCEKLQAPMLKMNPLFAKTVAGFRG